MGADFSSRLLSSTWAYPALEVLHLVGVALLLGNLVLLEMRVFGWGRALPAHELARLALTLAAAGFGLAVLSGGLMFAAQPAELIANRAFTFKMLLLLAAACNAAWFHGRGSLDKLDALARAQMVLSTLIWLAVLACGRWIAYL
ncbi:membrane protein [Hylemonella gracilis str. Niagara R]|uniref:Membrane protein n=1 Tax=Hylemonella gracilis str. Niagara R TaxID=1458275 RepID=A0A016XGF7_9BURK|nr:hypothetical protein [Hylemonella gracilis]EYC50980.1 membrane protein [Hylemonella gracilis str. Niagara R]